MSIDINDPSHINQVVSAVIGDDLFNCFVNIQICIIGNMQTNKKFSPNP